MEQEELMEELAEVRRLIGRNNSVSINNIDIPFWDMVTFMVKCAIASIPAMIIIFIIGTLSPAIFGGVLGALIR